MKSLREILAQMREETSLPGSQTHQSLSDLSREERCPHGETVHLYRYVESYPWQEHNRCLKCGRERHKVLLYRVSGIPEISWPGNEKDATFESFDLSLNPKMEEPLRRAKRYCEDGALPWLVLVGLRGNGKTHLSKAIAFTFLEKMVGVQFWSVPVFLDQLRVTFGPNSESDFMEEMQRLAYLPKLVVVDDYGTESPTPWANERLYLVLNARYEQGLRTVITCNRPADLGRDERIKSRLYDRSMCQVVHCKGEDMRPKLRVRRRRK